MISHHIAQVILTAGITLGIVTSATEVADIALHKVTPPPIEGSAVMPAAVSAGETVTVTWNITKRTACDGVNSRSWIGASGFHMVEEPMPTALPADGVQRTWHIPTKIPEYAGLGDLELTIKGWYECPGAERQEFTLEPVKTTVVEK